MDRNSGRNIDLNEEYIMRDLDLNVEFNRRELDLNVDYNESDQNLPTGWLHQFEDHHGAIIPDPFEVNASNGSNISHPSQTTTYNSVNVSAPYSGPANSQPEQPLAGFVQATVGPVSGTQHLSEGATQAGSQRLIQLEMVPAYSEVSVLHSIHSAGYIINSQDHGQLPLPFQHDQFVFSNSAEYPVREVASGQSSVHVPIFHETPQVFQWSNIMRPSNVPAPFSPAYAGTESDSVTPSHVSRRIQTRTMPGPQTGMVNLAHFAANISSRFGMDYFERLLLNAQAILYEEAMAYEALAARPMRDQTDNESLRMSEEDILMLLRREKFQSVSCGTSGSDEFCCICQENYGNGDDIGKIDCRHRYHFDCIKEWLLLRNSCPICKRKALAAGS